jgi:hypothetical protein
MHVRTETLEHFAGRKPREVADAPDAELGEHVASGGVQG